MTAMPDGYRFDEAQPYRPRIRFPPALTSAIVNRFARPRQPLATTLEGASFALGSGRVDPEWRAGDVSDCELLFRVASVGEFALRLPIAAIERILAPMGVSHVLSTATGTAALLVELALEPLLERLEAMGCPPIQVAALRPASRAGAARPALVLEGELDRRTFGASIALDNLQPNEVEFLLRLIETAPLRPATLLSVPLDLAFVLGHTRLTLGQLQGMRAGDALLPDIWHPAQQEAVVRLGERMTAAASFDGWAVTLQTGFQPSMQDDGSFANGQPAFETSPEATAGLNDLGVTVSFELGRRTVELGDLQQVGPGHVFELGGFGAVDVMANGRKIGQGEMVEVGELLAVRIVRFFDRA